MAGQSTGCCGHRRFNKRSGVPAMELVRQFIRDEDGQDVVEYCLLIATIAIVVLVGISIFGNNISAWFSTLAGRITTNS
jgi:pilus assembly protein Flp/PilA